MRLRSSGVNLQDKHDLRQGAKFFPGKSARLVELNTHEEPLFFSELKVSCQRNHQAKKDRQTGAHNKYSKGEVIATQTVLKLTKTYHYRTRSVCWTLPTSAISYSCRCVWKCWSWFGAELRLSTSSLCGRAGVGWQQKLPSVPACRYDFCFFV